MLRHENYLNDNCLVISCFFFTNVRFRLVSFRTYKRVKLPGRLFYCGATKIVLIVHDITILVTQGLLAVDVARVPIQGVVVFQ